MILTTELLKQMIDDTLGVKNMNTVTMNFSLRSHEDPSFEIKDIIVDGIQIIQDFSKNLTDDITVSINLQQETIMELVKHQTLLYATIILEYIDRSDDSVVLDEPPVIYVYKVFIHDLTNLAKKVGINNIYNTDNEEIVTEAVASGLMPVTLQLISEDHYLINKSAFVGMLKDATVADAIKFISSKSGIKSLNLIEPDNHVVYRHLMIPPQYWEFSIIFEFLQQHYGVYNKGINYYIDHEILYVYPPKETKPDKSPELEVIKTPPMSYIGSNNYHEITSAEGDITIVSTGNSIHQTLSNIATENEGNANLFLNSDQMVDGQMNYPTMELNNIGATASNVLATSIHKKSAIPTYTEPTINTFDRASKLSGINTELIALGWSYARLFVFYPGMPVTYIYDEKDNVMSKKGILEHVTYTMLRGGNISSKPKYTVNSTLILRLGLDAEIYEV